MIEIKYDRYDNDCVILCPQCEGSYLHQGKVDVFDCLEDARKGNHVVINNQSTIVDDNLSGNPSPRRQGLKISFDCEDCSGPITLNIFQHKGRTYLGFD